MKRTARIQADDRNQQPQGPKEYGGGAHGADERPETSRWPRFPGVHDAVPLWIPAHCIRTIGARPDPLGPPATDPVSDDPASFIESSGWRISLFPWCVPRETHHGKTTRPCSLPKFPSLAGPPATSLAARPHPRAPSGPVLAPEGAIILQGLIYISIKLPTC